MRLVLELTPEEVQVIRKYRPMLKKYDWRANGKIVDAFSWSGGGYTGEFEDELETALVVALRNGLQRALQDKSIVGWLHQEGVRKP
jgi:hypothetical protein